MKLNEQEILASRTKEFLQSWGLKAIYVSKQCRINPRIFSAFINNHVTLSSNQIARLSFYMEDYERRNS